MFSDFDLRGYRMGCYRICTGFTPDIFCQITPEEPPLPGRMKEGPPGKSIIYFTPIRKGMDPFGEPNTGDWLSSNYPPL